MYHNLPLAMPRSDTFKNFTLAAIEADGYCRSIRLSVRP